MTTFNKITSNMMPLPANNVDTDQIIPAKFLKVTDKESVAEGLFSNWRYNADGSPNSDFVLNQSAYQNAKILLAGDNFGCGSSREHAPWALIGNGFHVVISTSFADIFNNNALKNGLLPIRVSKEMHQTLFDLVEEAPQASISVDLASQQVSLPGEQSFEFEIDPFAKNCLLTGVDQLGYLLSFDEKITAYENSATVS